ncbi:hypothetical protein QBZ16_001587 [Prototheca wickerhamii]|uniref:AP2/ERF domain-containing protein n=1 Tax=Prototheca wickerhamii TaxID=3111 RepID=A0AAD9ID87_PROWI|nr:hypothetical protein QBZ16_001587 [Prototheca wickerhamii]
MIILNLKMSVDDPETSPLGLSSPRLFEDSAGNKSARLDFGPSLSPGALPQGFVPTAQAAAPGTLLSGKQTDDIFGEEDLSPVDVLCRHDSGMSSLLRGPGESSQPSTPRSVDQTSPGSHLLTPGARGFQPPAHSAPAGGHYTRTKAVPTGENGVFTSLFRGVTKHRLTGRYEAHFWDASHKREVKGKGGRTRGRQVYLGGYTSEEEAARAYDLAALAFLGPSAPINFPLEDYAASLLEMEGLSSDEVVSRLRRGSYRGVTKHHQHGKWEARIGRVDGSKYLYLGTFESAEEAARAYDRAAVKFRGRKAITNFKLSDYEEILADPDRYDVVLPAVSGPPTGFTPPAGYAMPGGGRGVQTRSSGRARRGTAGSRTGSYDDEAPAGPLLPLTLDPRLAASLASYARELPGPSGRPEDARPSEAGADVAESHGRHEAGPLSDPAEASTACQPLPIANLSPVKVHSRPEPARQPSVPSPLTATLLSPLGLRDRRISSLQQAGPTGDAEFWAAVQWLDSLDLAPVVNTSSRHASPGTKSVGAPPTDPTPP